MYDWLPRVVRWYTRANFVLWVGTTAAAVVLWRLGRYVFQHWLLRLLSAYSMLFLLCSAVLVIKVAEEDVKGVPAFAGLVFHMSQCKPLKWGGTLVCTTQDPKKHAESDAACLPASQPAISHALPSVFM